MEEERWLTVQKIANRLDINEQTVRRWLRSAELPGVLIADRAGYRVREKDLYAFLRARGWEPFTEREEEGKGMRAAA